MFVKNTYNRISAGVYCSGSKTDFDSVSSGSIPDTPSNFQEKVMKRKPIAAPRRQFVVAAKFRTGAGVHRKSHKALRKAAKQSLMMGV